MIKNISIARFFFALLIFFLSVDLSYAHQKTYIINYTEFGHRDLSLVVSNTENIQSIERYTNHFTTLNELTNNEVVKHILLAGKICGDTYYSNDMYAECPRELVDPEGNFPKNNSVQPDTSNDDAQRAYHNAWDRSQQNVQNMANGTNNYDRRLNGTYNNNLPNNGDAVQRYHDAQSEVQNNLQDMANRNIYLLDRE